MCFFFGLVVIRPFYIRNYLNTPYKIHMIVFTIPTDNEWKFSLYYSATMKVSYSHCILKQILPRRLDEKKSK